MDAFAAGYQALKALDLGKTDVKTLRSDADRLAAAALALDASVPSKLEPVVTGLEGDITRLEDDIAAIGSGPVGSSKATIEADIAALETEGKELKSKLAPTCEP